MSRKMVVGVVGMPGSGKSVVDDVAGEQGFFVVIMGDIIREEVMKRGLKPTSENVGKVMLQIRREEGPAVVSDRCILKIKSAENQGIVIDGIRSLSEVDMFRREFQNFKLLSIHSSPKIRFQRIFSRRRRDDPLNWKVFANRDLRELKVGIGQTIAMADHVIPNEESLHKFKIRVRKFLKASLSE